jgi:hypothetical protein
MAILSKGTDFSTGDQVTATKLDNLVDNATFASGAVDNSTTQLSGAGQIIVKDGGISTAKIADSAVTTAKISDSNVTKAKIENVADMKVLGNTSGSAAAPQEVSVLDEDDMSSDSDTAIATQQSIKAYVDSAPNFTPSTYAGGESVTFPNGLIIKFGTVTATANGNTTVNYDADFLSGVVSAQLTIQEDNNGDRYSIKIASYDTGSLVIRNTVGADLNVNWLVIGY